MRTGCQVASIARLRVAQYIRRMGSLSVAVADHIAVVTIDRPPVNAVDTQTYLEMIDVFASFSERRDVRVVILTAAGTRAFVGGADLKSIDDPDPANWPSRRVLDRGVIARDAMWAIGDCAVPVIGAINGPAIGAGLAIAAMCDMLVVADHASFGLTEINVGMLGASSHLSLLVGRHIARELFFTGELISATELQSLGAIRHVVPGDAVMTTAIRLAQTLSAKSPIALRLAKESMNRAEFLPLKDAYRTEQDYTARLLTFDDAAEAKAAFLEKRDAEWKWR